MGNNFEYEKYIIQSHQQDYLQKIFEFYIYFIKWIKFKKCLIKIHFITLKSFSSTFSLL